MSNPPSQTPPNSLFLFETPQPPTNSKPTSSQAKHPSNHKTNFARRLYEQTPGSLSSRNPKALAPATSKDDLSMALPSPAIRATPGDLTPRIFQAKKSRENAEKERVRRRHLSSRQKLAESSASGRAHLLRQRPLGDPRTEPTKQTRKPANVPKLNLNSLNQQRNPPPSDAPPDTSYIPVVPYNPMQARKTNDFIESLKTQKNYVDIFANHDAFIYLQRVSMDSAYDFVIVPHETVMESQAIHAGKMEDPNELEQDPGTPYQKDHRVHYTLSASGITSNVDGDVEFISLDAFEREYQCYKHITKIDFFTKYHVWKGFTQWKKTVSSKRIERAKLVLQDSLFILNEDLRVSLIKLRRLCYELSLLRLHQIDPGTTLDMEAFVEQQVRQKKKLQTVLDSFAAKMIEIVRNTCDTSLANFLASCGFDRSTSMDDAGVVTQISFTERAAMRTFCRKLAKFIRLADFFTCNSFILIAIHSTKDLLDHMIRGQDLVDENIILEFEALLSESEVAEKKEEAAEIEIALKSNVVKKSLPLFEIELILAPDATGSLEFSPNELLLKTRLENMLFDSLNVVSKPTRLLTHEQFEPYVEASTDESGPVGDIIELDNMLMEDEGFQDMLEEINEITENAFDRANTYCDSFDESVEMYDGNEEFLNNTTVEHFMSSTTDNLRELLETFHQQNTKFCRIKTSENLGMLSINTTALNDNISTSPSNCLNLIQRLLPQMYASKNETLLATLTHADKRINMVPDTVQEFTELSVFFFQLEEDLPQFEDDYHFLKDLYDLMIEYKIILDDEVRTRATMLSKTFTRLKDSSTDVEDTYDENKQKFTKALLKQVQVWQPKMQTTITDIKSPVTENIDADISEVIEYLKDVEATMTVLQRDAGAYSDQQGILKVSLIDLEEMEEARRTLETKLKLWNGIAEWNLNVPYWDDLPFTTLDIVKVSEEIHQFWVLVVMCDKALEESAVASNFVDQIQDYRMTMPVVSNLRNPSLKERHWEQIRLLLKNDISENSKLTLGDLITDKTTQHASAIATVTTKAENEEILSKMLKKIVQVWDYEEFEVITYRDRRDYYILAEIDEITLLLDDSIVSINTILGSQYVGAIRDSVEEWKTKLLMLQSSLEIWMTCQKSWMHLETIFAAPDIQKQLPEEAKSFKNVDSQWKDVMKRTYADPNCIRNGTIKGLDDMFDQNNAVLDKVQKGLDEYLEVKRQAFPRFYFLADEELLKLLAKAREPMAVQPHLRKLFDGLYTLDFGEQATGTTIHAMYSQDRERISMGTNLKARGNLEDWLGNLVEHMKKVIHRLTKVALNDIQTVGAGSVDGRTRADWTLQHPAQCITTVAQLIWAHETEGAIKGGPSAMARWYNINMAQLEELTEVIRSELSPVERKIAVALVTADVHARDIVDTLIQQKVTVKSSFVWQAQLRYYWEEPEARGGSNNDGDESVFVKQSNSIIKYGFEYLGPTTRLVITPLTDRCWMTITGAYNLKLGAGPAGPAGTGKTESSKDLAKALAIYCVVFNCSEQIDTFMMGRVFSGLAQCGAWTCLDEFNRIGIEVLSVIAQQITILRQGRITLESLPNSPSTLEVNFEGRDIHLRDHHVIITMNPTYAGRTELPDNLKTHFRPCNMMIPDYSLISEIIMYAEGFGHSTVLSKKLTKLYKMAGEMLSQQPHYDFGMRAVKSVLIMAGNLKREDPDAHEDELLISAMNRANVPKLLEVDQPLYQALVADIFPSTTLTHAREDDVAHCIRKVLIESSLQFTSILAEKAVQLNETLGVRFGVALVGEAGSGKTTLHRMLAKTLTHLYHDYLGTDKYNEGQGPQPVVSHVINPKSISVGELYGSFNLVTQEWKDGIAAYLIRQAANPAEEEQHTFRWTVFDGPIDPRWVENLNTVLDDNMLLCLASGERIKLRHEMKMLFEVCDLNAASPATVSRMGVVYVPPHTVGISALYLTWCSHIMKMRWPFMENEVERMRSRFHNLSLPVAEFLRDRCEEPIPTNDIGAMNTQCKILESLITAYFDPIFKFRRGEDKHRLALLDQFFFHSLVWGWGSALEGDFAESFNIFVRDLLSELNMDNAINIPPFGSVFDYFLDVNTKIGEDKTTEAVMTATGHNENQAEPFSVFPKFVEKPKEQEEEENELLNPLIGGVKKEDPNPLYVWREWKSTMSEYVEGEGGKFFEIIVPTVDIITYGSLFKVLSSLSHPIFMTGESGCGKSVLIDQMMKLMAQPPSQGGIDAIPLTMHFSSHTSSTYVQHSFEKKMEKKRKNLYGAPKGKSVIAFVDDVNMPAPDKHMSQPPIELLRQVLDQNGFYEREKLFWIEVEDCLHCAASAPPGGGRHTLPSRFLRHYAIACLPTPNANTMRGILQGLLEGFMGRFNDSIMVLSRNMISATLDLYTRITTTLLPTPSRSHYLFNLRDISKVFQGVRMGDERSVGSPEIMGRLWLHELTRVFHDRLINESDREWYYNVACELIIKHFRFRAEGWSQEELFPAAGGDDDDFAVDGKKPKSKSGEAVKKTKKKQPRPLMWVDFLRPGLPVEERVYAESKNMKTLMSSLDDFQTEYNLSNTTQMNLVFFTDAVRHLTRICRVLRQRRGSVMLIGVGGSGRSSLCRLAAHIVGCGLETPEMVSNYNLNNFRDDLKRCILTTGIGGKSTVFMLSDTQVTDERYLEDINSILGCGEIPSLFDDEEDADIIIKMRAVAVELGTQETPDACKALFVDRVRDHLHIALCMSPVGPELRERVRHFPSLISNTTIDWFEVWPSSALLSVSKRFISSIELEPYKDAKKDKDGEILRKALCDWCVKVHTSVQEAADKMIKSFKRKVYATPKSYVDMVTQYLTMLKANREALEKRLKSMVDGIAKLEETNETVHRLDKELTLMRPDLEKKAKGAAELLKYVEAEQSKATAVQLKVSQDEANVTKRQAEVSALQMDAKRDLAKAMPAYQNAVKALESLEKKDIIEIRGFVQPPLIVQTVMEAVCILLGEQPTWDSARKILNRPTYMDDLANFDKDNISASTLRKISKYIEDPSMAPESVKRVSVAAGGMCMWVHAMDVYSRIAGEVAPKQARLEKMNEELEQANTELKEKQNELTEVMAEVSSLQKKCDETLNEKNRLTIEVERCSQRLARAEKLKVSLEGERVRWIETVKTIKVQLNTLVGDVFLGAASVSYLGPFVEEYRTGLVNFWREDMVEKNINHSPDYSLITALGDPAVVRDWRISGLPKDDFSAENGIIATQGIRWPLMIDPEEQAGAWVKGYYGKEEKDLVVVSAKSERLMAIVSKCVKGGKALLIEDIPSSPPPLLDALLYKRWFNQGGKKVIVLGDQTIIFHENFRLFMSTRARNPKFGPDVFIRTTVLNFTVTESGLQSQLLAGVLSILSPSTESKYNNLIVSISKDKKELQSIEDGILRELEMSKGHLLDNEALINTLSDSKTLAAMVLERVAENEITEVEINKKREEYRQLAVRGSRIYFLLSGLMSVDPMYSYSLAYFEELFLNCIRGEVLEEASNDMNMNLKATLRKLAERTTEVVHRNVSRGLFDRHRLLFSFLTSVEVIKAEEGGDAVSQLEWSLLLGTGGGAKGKVDSYLEKYPNPDTNVIPPDTFETLCLLAKSLPCFEGILDDMERDWGIWKYWILSQNVHVKKLPGKWEEKMNDFQRLILVRTLCPEFGQIAVRMFVEKNLGDHYIGLQNVDSMEHLLMDMAATTPALFILSQGTDPYNNWASLVKKKDMEGRAGSISLGQGQGHRAVAMIEGGKRTGNWVLLQNVHLARGWMDELERLVSGIQEDKEGVSKGFRLFLTSLPVDYFPVRILQACIKVTTESPLGVRANVARSLEMNVDSEMFDEENFVGEGKGFVWRKLLYSLCVFHAVVCERRKFGPIGFNATYAFSDSDLTTASLTLRRMLGSMYDVGGEGKTPLDSLSFVTGQIVYGGRITDNWDRRTLQSIMRCFYNESALVNGYSFVVSGSPKEKKTALAPDGGLGHKDVMKWIETKVAVSDPPSLFGMHGNADVSCNLQRSNSLFTDLKSMVSTVEEVAEVEREEGTASASTRSGRGDEDIKQKQKRLRARSRGASMGGLDPDSVVSESTGKILEELPDNLNWNRASQRHTMDGASASSIVLHQEIEKFNILLKFIKSTLSDLIRAILGEVVMSQGLELIYQSIYLRKVPASWHGVGFKSEKGLGAWVDDLRKRVEFMKSWMEVGRTKVFQLPAFFFPQGFLTGVLQDYSRKHMVPINLLDFAFEVLLVMEPQDVKDYVEDGVLISGLWMQGCSWDFKKKKKKGEGEDEDNEEESRDVIVDSAPGKISTPCPILHFLPDEDHEVESDVYVCPCYKTAKRSGLLGTSGISTNFIVSIELPSDKGMDFWILRGAALLCEVDE